MEACSNPSCRAPLPSTIRARKGHELCRHCAPSPRFTLSSNDLTPEWLDPVAVARAVHAHRQGWNADRTREFVGRALHYRERTVVTAELHRLRDFNGPVPVNWSLAGPGSSGIPTAVVAIPAPRKATA